MATARKPQPDAVDPAPAEPDVIDAEVPADLEPAPEPEPAPDATLAPGADPEPDARTAAIGALTGAGATAGGDTAPAPSPVEPELEPEPVDLGGTIRARVVGQRFNAMHAGTHRTVVNGLTVLVTEEQAAGGVMWGNLELLEED